MEDESGAPHVYFIQNIFENLIWALTMISRVKYLVNQLVYLLSIGPY